MRTLVHEMQHVKDYRCGDFADKHKNKKVYDAFNIPVDRTLAHLEKHSETFRLFEAWIEELQPTGTRDAYATVQLAADNALAGEAIPDSPKD